MFSIGQEEPAPQQKVKDRMLNPIRGILTNACIVGFCQEVGYRWRERRFGPVVTVLVCIWKHLEGVASVRDAEDWMASLRPEDGDANRQGQDFCAARARLPIRVFQKASAYVGEAAARAGGKVWQGMSVWYVDGTTSQIPRTGANLKVWGRATNQHGSSCLPLMRWVAIVCAGTGAVLDVAWGPYATAEVRLFIQMLLRFPKSGLGIGDTTFSSYMALALAQKWGHHLICRRYACRSNNRVQWLGRGDELHRWIKPPSGHGLFLHWFQALPKEMDVRVIRKTISRKGYRSYELVLCTTLLDPKRYPADAIVELYLGRWNMELDLRTLKGTHGLDRLSAKTPEVVVREFYSGILAFNAVRALMAQSNKAVRSLSHERARMLFLETASQMVHLSAVRLPSHQTVFLRLVGEATQIRQPRPPEPRAVIRSPKRYALRRLKMSRAAWRKQYLKVS